MPSPWGYSRMSALCKCDFMNTAWALCGDLAGFLQLSQEHTIIFGPKNYLKSWVFLTITLRCPYEDHLMLPAMLPTMCLRFFKICHSVALFNKIIEATMSVNPYDDHTVSLHRPHRKGDLEMVQA